MADITVTNPSVAKRHTHVSADVDLPPSAWVYLGEPHGGDGRIVLWWSNPEDMRRLAKELVAGSYDLEDAIRARAGADEAAAVPA